MHEQSHNRRGTVQWTLREWQVAPLAEKEAMLERALASDARQGAIRSLVVSKAWDDRLLLLDHVAPTECRGVPEGSGLRVAGAPPEALLVARCLLGDRLHFIRMEAADLLAIIGDKSDVTRLAIAARGDQSWLVRSSVAIALGYIGGRRAAGVLKRVLESDPHVQVRRDAARGLLDIDDPTDIAFIEERFHRDKSVRLRAAIAVVLYSFGRRDYGDIILRFATIGRGKVPLYVWATDLWWYLTDDDVGRFVDAARICTASTNDWVRASASKFLEEMEEHRPGTTGAHYPPDPDAEPAESPLARSSKLLRGE